MAHPGLANAGCRRCVTAQRRQVAMPRSVARPGAASAGLALPSYWLYVGMLANNRLSSVKGVLLVNPPPASWATPPGLVAVVGRGSGLAASRRADGNCREGGGRQYPPGLPGTHRRARGRAAGELPLEDVADALRDPAAHVPRPHAAAGAGAPGEVGVLVAAVALQVVELAQQLRLVDDQLGGLTRDRSDRAGRPCT
eukprot:2348336-Heterocapsa_arctica.AAC.1